MLWVFVLAAALPKVNILQLLKLQYIFLIHLSYAGQVYLCIIKPRNVWFFVYHQKVVDRIFQVVVSRQDVIN